MFRANQFFGERSVVAWIVDGLRGLRFLSQHKIIHCDINPHNLLLTDKLDLIISDLGLAHHDASSIPIKQPLGSFEYHPPEAFQDTIIDERFDVWSLGVSFWHIISGSMPWGNAFDGTTPDARIVQTKAGHRSLHRNTPQLRSLNFPASKQLRGLLTRMLIQRAALRPKAEALLKDKILLDFREKYVPRVLYHSGNHFEFTPELDFPDLRAAYLKASTLVTMV